MHTTERRAERWSDNAAIAATAQAMALLADATRLRLLFLVGEGERGGSDLGRATALPQPTVSHHLGLLRRAGLVQPRREGRQVFYRLTCPPTVSGALCIRTEGGVITVTPQAATGGSADLRPADPRANAA